jgi:hypothetical protein
MRVPDVSTWRRTADPKLVHDVGRLDLGHCRGEGDLLGTRRFDGEDGDVPCPRAGCVRDVAGGGMDDELDGHAEAGRQFPHHIHAHPAQLPVAPSFS